MVQKTETICKKYTLEQGITKVDSYCKKQKKKNKIRILFLLAFATL